MRTVLRNSIVIIIFSVICALAWSAMRPRDPIYQGRALTYWLKQYSINTYIMRESPQVMILRNDSKAAILHIGTNALPTLINMASTHDSTLTIKFRTWMQRLKPTVFDTSGERQLTSDELHILAATGFDLLGPLGKDAVPSLNNLLKSKYADVRATAVSSSGSIGPLAKETIPQLIHLINDSEQRVAIINALSKFGATARPVVPILLQYLNDQDKSVRSAVTNAIKCIDPAALNTTEGQ